MPPAAVLSLRLCRAHWKCRLIRFQRYMLQVLIFTVGGLGSIAAGVGYQL